METKAEKFQRLSTARLEKAQHALKQFEHLGSPNYEFTNTEALELVSALQACVDKVSEALRVTAPEPEPQEIPEKLHRPIDAYAPVVLTKAESIKLIGLGPTLGAAIEAETHEECRLILLNLTRS